MTVEVVFQEVATVLVKIVEDSDNKKLGLQCVARTYVCDARMCMWYLPCLFATLRRGYVPVLPVPETSVSFVRHSYPYPKLIYDVVFCRATYRTIPGVFTLVLPYK